MFSQTTQYAIRAVVMLAYYQRKGAFHFSCTGERLQQAI